MQWPLQHVMRYYAAIMANTTDMSRPLLKLQIHVVGLGINEPVELSSSALTVLRSADKIIGWQRHKTLVEPLLELYEPGKGLSEKGALEKTPTDKEVNESRFTVVLKLSELQVVIDSVIDNAPDTDVLTMQASCLQEPPVLKIVVVASGDPLYFGIGRWLLQRYSSEQLIFYPAVSSIQAACHRQGISLQDVKVVSLHGRALSTIRPHLKKNAVLVLLTDKNSLPPAIAQECLQADFAETILDVYADLGHSSESHQQFNVSVLAKQCADPVHTPTFSPLHITIASIKGEGGLYPEFPGIPDYLYQTGAAPGKGMITKREVRLMITTFMQPAKGDVIWDVGAGCGGVTVELGFWRDDFDLYAIEYRAERLRFLKCNIEHFGIQNHCHIVEGRAPQVLASLPLPNKIFIGGSDGELSGLLEESWQKLPDGGLLVASAVLDSTEAMLKSFACHLSQTEQNQIESVTLAVARNTIDNTVFSSEAKRPITLFKFQKLSDKVKSCGLIKTNQTSVDSFNHPVDSPSSTRLNRL